MPMAIDHLYPDAIRRQNRGFLGWDSQALSPRDRQDRRQLRHELDLNSWNLRIWGVAASGFLTDSYNLFASNVILASICFVYEPNVKWAGLLINVFTLLGSVIGQLLFGFLADYYGRTRLYGIELLLVIISTIGTATSSSGYDDMNFLPLFIWWRFVMGIGIGAEYPLSAVITAEWSSTSSRTTMLASVFLMQPIGQALAQLVGVWVLLGRDRQYGLSLLQCGLNDKYQTECKEIIDGVWRIVIGSGAIPALLAIIFRFFLYDCGLYTLEVKNKPGTAFRDTQRIYGQPLTAPNGISLNSPGGASQPEEPMPVQFSLADLRNYFLRDGNWYYLFGTSAAWFFLDISFYGFSLDKGSTLADLWATTGPVPINANLTCWESSIDGGTSLVPGWQQKGVPSWVADFAHPCQDMYASLIEQGKQYLLTVSLASIAGSACFIFLANRFPRRQWLTSSFLLLAVLFVILGGVYYGVAHTNAAPASVVLVAVCYFFFNFGANTLTFIVPAEIFPTCYRCTCHGISAAAGKAGSIVAVLIFYGINQWDSSVTRQGLIFLLFGAIMAIGAIFSWAYLPDVQRVVDDDDNNNTITLTAANRETSSAGSGRPGTEFGAGGYGARQAAHQVNGGGINGGVGHNNTSINTNGVPASGHAPRRRRFWHWRRLENKSLEELGEGREKARQGGQVITIRDKLGKMRRRTRLGSVAEA